MWFSNNKEQTELNKIKGVLFLRAQLSNETFSFSSENKEKIPGVETNPLSAAIHIILTFTWIMQMKKV